jgi:peptide/nickel transport system permease protein
MIRAWLKRSPIAWLGMLLLLTGLAAPLLATGQPLLLFVPGEGWSSPAISGAEPSDGASFVLPAPIPYSPTERVLRNRLEPPSWSHWLGTDHLGRDVTSRLIHGTRVSLGISVLATMFALLIGLFVGGIAGYLGGWPDLILSRLIEIFASFPALVLALTFVAFFPPGILSLATIIAMVGWTGIARHARAETLRIRNETYVEAARSLGAGRVSIIIRQLLPQALFVVAVPATFLAARAIIVEAALSMLGVGVAEPVASWGNVLALSRTYLQPAWWLALFPGCCLFVTLTICNRLGEMLSGGGGSNRLRILAS